jgi:hypothetical protein
MIGVVGECRRRRRRREGGRAGGAEQEQAEAKEQDRCRRDASSKSEGLVKHSILIEILN